MRVTCLKPGLLLSLKAKIVGGIEYDTNDVDEAREGNRAVKRWETTKTVYDEVEMKSAEEVRKDARNEIARECIATEFGAIFPSSKSREALDAAILRAKKMAGDFNETAKYTRVKIMVLCAQIMDNDFDAAQALTGEVADLLATMDKAIASADAEGVRDACNRAIKLSMMLDESTAAKASEAIKAARRAAKQIVKRIATGGEVAEVVLKDLAQDRALVEATRFRFLDLEASYGNPPAEGEAMPSVDMQRFAEVGETACEIDAPTMSTVTEAREIDMEAPADVADVPVTTTVDLGDVPLAVAK